MPEEEAFAVLVQIMQQHRMRDMFKPSMAELGKNLIVLPTGRKIISLDNVYKLIFTSQLYVYLKAKVRSNHSVLSIPQQKGVEN